MIWLTWRQFRAQAVGVLGALVGLAIVLLVTGPHLVQLTDSYLANCKGPLTCGANPDPATTTDQPIQLAIAAVELIVPALIGMFWGAPLIARELETGTYRLGWTQSVTRKRWLTAKLGAVGLAAVGTAGLLSLMATWWYSPIERVRLNQFQSAVFGLRDITPIGYAAFAFMLGVTVGLLTRRTLPAMASTLVGFIMARLAVTYWVRPHLWPPVHTFMALHSTDIGISLSPSGIGVSALTPNIPNAWVYSSAIVNASGQAPSERWLQTNCRHLAARIPSLPRGLSVGHVGVIRAHPAGSSAFNQCTTKVAAAFREVVVYQPANRYWDFQALETGVFLALAALLGGISFWWIRHRVA